ncbi:hypothetical protein CFE70_008852 [Pyrenophora teres f. teres 0-1]|uniref:Septin-type G domain-containing protein n=2 Tax=Pyrenophora teres f. teres TaxID=97479 RepID=E3RFD4_PYRTT|nr:hypothetical protein PTT_06040 [Pyrenophora teres f. teres 0-1]KAE8824771.1 hypothetical protein PTNB85_09535 [Pyrenophora teres f. teres]KAE8831791.1 hypothetical protein HRS9139_06033 [Pyrenophora teres f. teres]KAE8835473.1 hypothetical protein HRS9122_07743 [Pyrenophora teres f. teres]KAE8858373.1 hypothetical protein PTNB29_07588 [Pyrenophora teres f. teres]
MRPQMGGDALTPAVKPRSRKSSVDHAVAPWSNVPTTFVMKRADEVEQPMAPPQVASSTPRYQDGTYGVQSLADTLDAAFGPENTVPAKEPVKASKTGNHSARSSHTSSTNSVPQLDKFQTDTSRKLKRGRDYSAHGASTPLKLFGGAEIPSPHPLSALSSTPRSASITSLKLSDEEFAMDDVASQAVSSSGEEEESVEMEQAPSSFPQLVMPVMQMPTRRPFTTRGKAMGKLKVMVAGETGLGKSSLIRSIVQACEDIVHVDPLSPSPSIAQSRPPKSKSRTRKAGHAGTTRVTETHASTKPYPHWWADVEESRVLRRRKSGADTVLERNICFVDTPGYCHGPTEQDDMNMVVDYVESLLFQTSSVTTLEDNDALGVVSGSGGVLVDVVIYLLPPSKDITKDIDYMQQLSYLTNVIPVIAKSDTLSAQEVVALKTSILARLQTTALRPFFFGEAMDDALLAVQSLPVFGSSASGASSEAASYPYNTPTYPYAVSSTSGPDNDNMDASLLMSPDYVQPLLPSELGALVHQVFDPESIAWLRHSAAKKFLAWRRRTRLLGDSVIMQGITHPRSPTMASVGLNGATMNTSLASSVFSAASPSGVLVPGSGSPFYPSNLQSPLLSSASLANSETFEPSGSFSLAKYNKSMQGDQRFSEIRIARWATDLQRSRRNEKDRFEELQSNERAKWLLERVGEEVSRGTIVACPDGTPRAEWAVVRHSDEKGSKVGQRYAKAIGLNSRDPLGLCDFSDELRRRSFVLVKVLGGMSVVGAVVVAVIRACGIETGSPQNWWAWITGTE